MGMKGDGFKVLLSEAAHKKCQVCYVCHAGMREVIQPVFLDGSLAGFVMAGQFRDSKSPPIEVVRAWRRRNGDPTSLVESFEATPEISIAKLPYFLTLFSTLAGFMVSSRRMLSLEGDALVGRMLAELRCRPSMDMSLEEAARLSGRSKSTVSHTFKKVLGMPFKRAVLNMRIDRAEELLASGSGVSVKEVASSLGFDDQFYFSRIFKKHKGYPPSSAASCHPDVK